MWDVPLEIVGSGGEDKGQGGRYLILPPDFKGNVPAGYFPVRQQTYGGFWLLRTIPKSDSQADQNAAIALLKKIRMYPLSKTEIRPRSASSTSPASYGTAIHASTQASLPSWQRW